MIEKRFTLVDDYLIEYDGSYFDLHKPSNIRSLVTVIGYVTDENEQLKQYNQRITKVLEDGGVILTKNQLTSLIEMNNDDSVEVRYLKTANAKLKDEISALKEYIQKKEVIK